ncbi:major capsid protein [Streptomyces sp. TR02-1]|uniref:major capsid protein n=1 Tax=Streptomyces sp. TR02-1 TaxID=3385977 RepID=UPI00399F4F82
MNELLQRLLAAFSDHSDADARSSAVREILAEADEDLSSVSDAVSARFSELQTTDEQTSETVDEMEALAGIAEATTAEITAQAESAEREARSAAAAERMRNASEAAASRQAADNDLGVDNDDQEPEPGPGRSPDAPQTEEEAGQPSGDAGTGDGNEEVDAGASGREAVAASGGRGRVPLGGVPGSTLPSNREAAHYSLIAAPDIPGVPIGAELEGIPALAEAFTNRVQSLVRVGPGKTAQAPIASLRRNRPHQDIVREAGDVTSLVERMCSERNLPGGNLVAAGGWCAPSEQLYDMCPTATLEGLLDLPEVSTRRGGIKFHTPPDFATIYASLWPDGTGDDPNKGSFHYPEPTPPAEMPDKPCWSIPCVDNEKECRLEVDGLCIESPLLQERAWPEMVEYFMEQALAAHAHRLNAWKISRIVAGSTSVDIPSPGFPSGTTEVTRDPHGPGATASILSSVELFVEQARYRRRLSRNTTLEMVAPFWLRPIMRADLSKRNGVDMLSVTDAQLDNHLRARGVQPQWIWDWQDAYGMAADGTQTTTLFGGATPATQWPTHASILLYVAGTWFSLTQDVITLDGIYDSSKLAKNTYTKLFTEEGVQVCTRGCGDSWLLNLQLCPNGITGGQEIVACSEPPAPMALSTTGSSASEDSSADSGVSETASRTSRTSKKSS